jgi:hypothetical protein
MPSLKTLVLLSVVPFVLTACGEGWEKQMTDSYFPYGNQRTAGSGVAYVVAKMMPKKELKVTPAKVAPAPEPAPAPVKEGAHDVLQTLDSDMERLFKDTQSSKK